MNDYWFSEQLFLDVWNKYGNPDVICEKDKINEFLKELVEKSNTHIVLDHYSQINFDKIVRIESNDKYTLIYWFDKNNLRERVLSEENISEMEELQWAVLGFATYEYLLLDISKIRFIRIDNHLFVLLMSNLIPQRELQKAISKNNKIINVEEKTSNLYTRYTFWEGNPENIIKHICIVSNLPYYTCVIQPKENIQDTYLSKTLLLKSTIYDIKNRLANVLTKLLNTDEYDNDELFSIGNTIRRILEYVIKYYCVINKIDLEKLQVEQKYGYIKLSELKRAINDHGKFQISQELINIANELSHDSGAVLTKKDVVSFYYNAIDVIDEISKLISR
ncbi:MAG: hypothetical protein OSJ54_12920 [Oscillospiraceae bacterium]|nr:hypothetical protein [Oscillospiraceae bacterium]